MTALERYSWPGNIRELENMIKSYVILGSEDAIRLELLQDENGNNGYGNNGGNGHGSKEDPTSLKAAVRMLENRLILRTLEEIARLVHPLPLNLNLWKVQNMYYETMQSVLPWYQKKVAEGDEAAKDWMEHFTALGRDLNFAVLSAPQ